MGKQVKSLIQNDIDSCFFCGTRQGLQTHHIFMGNKNRNRSTEMNAVVRVCANCHTLSPHSIHRDREMSMMLMQMAQKEYEKQYSHEEFMKRIGKNYLD